MLHENTRIENILKRLSAVEKGSVHPTTVKNSINVDTESDMDDSSQSEEQEEHGEYNAVQQDFDGFSPSKIENDEADN